MVSFAHSILSRMKIEDLEVFHRIWRMRQKSLSAEGDYGDCRVAACMENTLKEHKRMRRIGPV